MKATDFVVKSVESETAEESGAAAAANRENVSADVLSDWDRSIQYGFKLTCASGTLHFYVFVCFKHLCLF